MDDHPEPPTRRFFVALAPPDEAKDELARALQPAYAAYPLLRWNRIADWHITLVFLGELPSTAAPVLRAALPGAAATHPALRLGLRGGGHFDGRTLWSGITGDLEGLHRLSTDVRELIRSHGLDFPDRPLRPHLTLARARREDPTGVPLAAAGLADFAGRTWSAERLHLVASNTARGPGPIRYRDLDSWPLAPTTHPGDSAPPADR
ncbi:RNA 2',3'-cyclic phosphodiesterase [Kitasatospora sp. NPDC092948]|uniref:RNA 2',3'-cyclic phosphodiesterase n=1 Tax=Kitasatospora sp. NPDC092948 TaxID=3364088 RepID=UPI00381A6319